MWALVLCLMIGFAAEPTTSTQLDVREGRGVVVVHRAESSTARAQTTVGAPARLPALAVVLLAATAFAGVAVRLSAARGPSQWVLRVLGATAPARRGPPALV